jgi:hypothetical protein
MNRTQKHHYKTDNLQLIHDPPCTSITVLNSNTTGNQNENYLLKYASHSLYNLSELQELTHKAVAEH